jgi:hypothetical protein
MGQSRPLAGYGTTCWLPYVTTFYYSLAIVRLRVWAYLEAMTNRNESSIATSQNNRTHNAIAAPRCQGAMLVRTVLFTALAALALAVPSLAADPPDAPSSVVRGNAPFVESAPPVQTPKTGAAITEIRPIDKTFVSLALISTGSTFSDSYTTLFARQNWLAGKKGVCNIEVQSAYLYGTHPTVGRAYAVASVKSTTSVLAAYYLRKHHNKFWSLPLVANSLVSLEGVTQNMMACN